MQNFSHHALVADADLRGAALRRRTEIWTLPFGDWFIAPT
jgi:hypothetical protein